MRVWRTNPLVCGVSKLESDSWIADVRINIHGKFLAVLLHAERDCVGMAAWPVLGFVEVDFMFTKFIQCLLKLTQRCNIAKEAYPSGC